MENRIRDFAARKKGKINIMKKTKNLSYILVLVVMALLTSVCMPVFADDDRTPDEYNPDAVEKLEVENYGGKTLKTNKSIRIMTWMGVVFDILAILLIIDVFIEYFTVGVPVRGWPMLTCIVVFTSGAIMFMLGIIGEYVWRTLDASRNRPPFIIDEINRGNMSKIFGELLMLIEKDYRGEKATLAYNGLSFSVPEYRPSRCCAKAE